MIVLEKKENCCGCGACASSCPQKCISMVIDEEGFFYPCVNTVDCVNCGLCEKVCPVINSVKKHEQTPIAVASYSKDSVVRACSSSGGIFTELAKEIISNGGVVCGAEFDEEFNLNHGFAQTFDEIQKLCGSKYIQSKTADTYKKTQTFLDSGTTVLFSGTPCQVNGLQNYLRKPYKNLITQEIICHGVPSQKLWQEYCRRLNSNKVTQVSFRDKKYGWHDYSYVISFSDKRQYRRIHNNDAYSRMFLQNFSLRPSCYKCAFKNKRSSCDLTLGDFWGIEKVLPEICFEDGVSLVIINSSKGKEIFESISDRLVSEEVDFEAALNFNKAKTQSVNIPKERNDFYKDLNNNGFDYIRKKYLKETVVVKIKRTIKNAIKIILK